MLRENSACVLMTQSSTEAVSSTSQDGSIKPQTSIRQAIIPPAHKLSLNNVAKSSSQAAVDKVMLCFFFGGVGGGWGMGSLSVYLFVDGLLV